MKLTHDHPDESTLGLRKETYEELQTRVADVSRAAAHHLAVRQALAELLRKPTASMIQCGEQMRDMGGSAEEIYNIMTTHGMLELFHAGKL